jgi:hypothetical protein
MADFHRTLHVRCEIPLNEELDRYPFNAKVFSRTSGIFVQHSTRNYAPKNTLAESDIIAPVDPKRLTTFD